VFAEKKIAKTERTINVASWSVFSEEESPERSSIGARGARAIAEHMTSLTSLNLYYNSIGA
jgi:hypothetical protein